MGCTDEKMMENIPNHTHEIGHGNPHGRQHHALVLVGDVVVIPHVEDDTGRARAPGHHEAGKVRHGEVRVVDGREDDEADASKSEAQRDKGKPQPRIVRREAQDQQHDGARDVGGHRV